MRWIRTSRLSIENSLSHSLSPSTQQAQASALGSHSSRLPRSSVQGGFDVIRNDAWPFYRTISGVCLCWELEEPKGPQGSRDGHRAPPPEEVLLQAVLQGYIAHKKQPPPLGPPQGPRHSPTVESWEVAVSHERGTPVIPPEEAFHARVFARVAKSLFSPSGSGFQKSNARISALLNEFTPSNTQAWLMQAVLLLAF